MWREFTTYDMAYKLCVNVLGQVCGRRRLNVGRQLVLVLRNSVHYLEGGLGRSLHLPMTLLSHRVLLQSAERHRPG